MTEPPQRISSRRLKRRSSRRCEITGLPCGLFAVASCLDADIDRAEDLTTTREELSWGSSVATDPALVIAVPKNARILAGVFYVFYSESPISGITEHIDVVCQSLFRYFIKHTWSAAGFVIHLGGNLSGFRKVIHIPSYRNPGKTCFFGYIVAGQP